MEEINAIRNHLESERPDQNPGDFSPTYEQSESVIVRNRSKHYSERLARITEAAQSPSYRIDRDDLRWLLGHVSQWFSEVEQRGETPE